MVSLLFVYVTFISSDLPNIFILVQFWGIVLAVGAVFENILYATHKKKTISKDGDKLFGKFIWPLVVVCVVMLLVVCVVFVAFF